MRFTASPGTTEFAKRWNPGPGDLVTFKHHGFLLESKKPKLPTLYRLRTDLTWDNVVDNWKERKTTLSAGISRTSLLFFSFFFSFFFPFFHFLNLYVGGALPLNARKSTTTSTTFPKGYWRDQKNRENFFLEFAKERGIADPLNPSSWARVTGVQIRSKKGVTRFLFVYMISLLYMLIKCNLLGHRDTFEVWRQFEACLDGYLSWYRAGGEVVRVQEVDVLEMDNLLVLAIKEKTKERRKCEVVLRLEIYIMEGDTSKVPQDEGGDLMDPTLRDLESLPGFRVVQAFQLSIFMLPSFPQLKSLLGDKVNL